MRFLPDWRFRRLWLASASITICLTLMLFSNWQGPRKTSQVTSVDFRSHHYERSTEQQPKAVRAALGGGGFVENVAIPPIPASVLGPEKQRSMPLAGKAIMEIRFVDEVTKDPVASGKIMIEPFFGPDFEVSLDDNGAITLAADPGEYSLRSTCQGYCDWRDEFEVAEGLAQLQKTIPLARLIKVHGIVKKVNGEPEQGAELCFFQDGRETIGASGFGGLFEIDLAAHDIKKFYAFKPPHPVTEIGPISLDESHIPFITITLPAEDKIIKLSGRVLDDHEKAVSNASISVLQSFSHEVVDEHQSTILRLVQSSYQRNSIRTDAEGRFMGEVQPERGVTLMVTARNLAPYYEKTDLVVDAEKIIHLKSYPIFRIRILDLSESDLTGMKVAGYLPDGKPVGVYPASEKGKYFAAGYPIRLLADCIRKHQGIAVSQVVPEYQEEIVLKQGDGRISGRVTDDGGKPIKFFMITLNSVGGGLYHPFSTCDFYSQSGLFTLEHIIPGEASISVIPGFSEQRKNLQSAELGLPVWESSTTYVYPVLTRK